MVDKKFDKDINDIFDDILFSEEKISQQGFEEGYRVGATQENTEAYHLGYHRGAEIGAELGFYYSFINHYIETHQSERAQISDKLSKTISSLKDSIEKFPHNNDENTDLKDSLSNIRVKFKLVCSLLKVNVSFSEGGELTF
ncbi:hypothetical protein WA026_005497 [Henosepilachna vigintioctopunctata]|uniref:Uncharacterized protein n=1 Tax=Henosepilachna vigintioctopunctata TaxID=420089 RepID=A0AAW1TT24_9CUCU